MRPRAAQQLRLSGRRRSGSRSRMSLLRAHLGFAGLLPRPVGDRQGDGSGRHLGRLFRVVCERHELQVVGRDRAGRQHVLLEPLEKAAPVRGAEEDDRKVLDLPGLRERQRFEQLIEGAEPAGEDDKPAGVLDEHVLADEEVAELDAEVDVAVQRLLVRKLDVAANRQPARIVAALVDRLHDPWPAAGDDRKAAIGERAADLLAGLVVGVLVLGPRRTEDGHRGAYLVERIEALDELREDAEDAPWVGVVAELFDRAALEQGAVGRRLLGRDDEPAGAPSDVDLPPFRVVHQASDGTADSVSTAPSDSCATGTASGSVLASPFEEAVATGSGSAGVGTMAASAD